LRGNGGSAACIMRNHRTYLLVFNISRESALSSTLVGLHRSLHNHPQEE
jgi:hypothetical protein